MLNVIAIMFHQIAEYPSSTQEEEEEEEEEEEDFHVLCETIKLKLKQLNRIWNN